jgi:hypothetical protein
MDKDEILSAIERSREEILEALAVAEDFTDVDAAEMAEEHGLRADIDPRCMFGGGGDFCADPRQPGSPFCEEHTTDGLFALVQERRC